MGGRGADVKGYVRGEYLFISFCAFPADITKSMLSICLQRPIPAHLDVNKITSASIFEKTLELVWSEYEKPIASFRQF